MGQNNLAVLTGDRIKVGFFTRKCVGVLPGRPKKSGQKQGDRITEVAVRLGSAVLFFR